MAASIDCDIERSARAWEQRNNRQQNQTPWKRQGYGKGGGTWRRGRSGRHPMYQALGDEEAIRRRRYQEFLEEAIPPGEWELIREAVKRGQLTGNTRFAEAVEQIIGRRTERRGPGRPLKNEPEG